MRPETFDVSSGVIHPDFIAASTERSKLWHGDKPWNAAELLVATAGELGELAAEITVEHGRGTRHLLDLIATLGQLCNDVKKSWRIRDDLVGQTDSPAEVLAAVSKGSERHWLVTRAIITPEEMMAKSSGVTIHAEAGAEWADTFAYLTVLADTMLIDPTAESVEKFNSVSAKAGFDLNLRGR